MFSPSLGPTIDNTLKNYINMKKIISTVKDYILVGIAVLVPIAVIGVVLSGTLKKLVAATSPITNKLSFGGPLVKTIIATAVVVVVLAVFFFLSGVLFKTYLGSSFKNWLEKKIFARVPFYETIKNVTSQLTGVKKSNYSVVEVSLNKNDTVILGLLTETLSDGRHVVYCPYSPLINIGQMHIVSEEHIKRLDLSLKEFTDVITKLGFESDKIYKKNH
jgi:uncharacterized membrane protein